MSFIELGSVLRAEREKRGLSLDNVAEHLKISARILRALEEGDESSLPHTVYVRGFVRSYGNYLGLDSKELQEGMTSLTDEEQDVQPANVYMAPELDNARGGGKLFLLIFVLLCAAGAAFFWFYRDADLFSDLQQARLSTAQPAPPLNARPEAAAQEASSKSGAVQKDSAAKDDAATPRASATAPPALQPEQAVPAQKTAPAQAGTQAQQPGQQAAQQPVTPAAANQAAAAAGQNAAMQNGASQTAANQGGTAQANAASVTRDVAPVTGHHKIIITALSECWIHSNADSTDTRQFSLRKGDTFALTFADKLVLKLGNAGGVRIRYNGEDLPQQGKEGQVKTLTFPLAAQ